MAGWVYLKHLVNKRNDPRIKNLSLPAKGIYYMLTEVAFMCNENGSFIMNDIQLTVEQIATLVAVDVVDLKKAIREMKKTKIISENGHGPFLTDYKDEQISKEEREERRKRNADKSQAYRDRQHEKSNVTSNENEYETGNVISDVTLKEKSQESRVKKETLSHLTAHQVQKVNARSELWNATWAVAMRKNNFRPTYLAGILRNKIDDSEKPTAKVTPKITGKTIKL